MNLEELLNSKTPPKKDDLTDEDLARFFIKYKGLLKKLERDEAFWAATNENIKRAYSKLDELVENRTIELKTVNEQLQQELTERKKAEKKLKESEEQLRLERDNLINILNSIEDGVYITNQQYDIEFVNPVLIQEFGPFEKKKCFEYFHDREEVCPWCKNQEVFAGKTVRWEWFSFKNQKTYDLVDTLLKNPNGSMSKLEIFRDITERKKVEQEIKIAREKFESLVENIPSAVYSSLADEKGTTLFISNRWSKWTGYAPNDFYKDHETWSKSIHPDDREKAIKAYVDAYENKRDNISEYRLIHKDTGKITHVRDHGRPIFDENGNIVRYDGIVTDITERKKAEEALKESEIFNRLLVDTLPIGLALCHMDGSLIDVNPAYAKILGRSIEETLKLTYWDITPKKYNKQELAQLESMEKTGHYGPYEKEYIHRDGHLVPVRLSGLIIEKEDEQFIWSSVEDIAERKKAEEEIRYHAMLVENVSDAIISTDNQFRIRSWNKAAETIYGWHLDEVIDKPYNDILQLEFSHTTREEIQKQLLHEPEGWSGEAIHKRKDGTILNIFASASLLKDIKGDMVGIVAIIRDITERKKVEQQLKASLEDLKRSNTELEEFAYVASHDLQEPLRMVASFTQLLERRYKDKLDDDANDFINFIVGGTTRMQGLINDLLVFSRVGTHARPFKATDMNIVLENVLINIRQSIKETNVTITNDPLPVIVADDSQMMQLFQNLISNALKFHGEEEPRIHVSGEVKEEEWIFSVRDNGIGVDSKNFDRIFVIFQRLHKKDEYGGTGIGLAVCKKIIQRHRGKIWLESELGKGSTFYFSIPKLGVVKNNF